MRFDNKKDINPKYLLLLLTIICVVLIIVSYFAGNKIAFIKQYTNSFIAPLQTGIDKIGIWTDSKVKNMQDIEKLTAENEELQQELDSYKEKTTKYQNELQELNELRSLYTLDDEYPELNKTAAHVFAKDTTSWFSTFYIDKGTNDGIFKNANIMCGEGLCGVVIECYDSYSKVRAIIDDKSNVSATIMPSNALCTIEGNLNNYEYNYIIAKNIDKDAAVSIGDKVVTSRVSDRYHPGILIGYVSELTLDTNNLTMTAKITPVVDFSNIGTVLVITDKKQTVDNENE